MDAVASSSAAAAAATNGRSTGRIDLNYRLCCKICKKQPPNIIEDTVQGDLVCGDCGLVFEGRIIDTRSEWRTFQNDEANDDPSRVGNAANPLLDDGQLDTQIGFRDGGSGAAKELNRTHSRVTANNSQKVLIAGYKDITAFCDRAALPKIVQDRAKQLFKKIQDESLLRGKSPDQIIAACLYVACRQERAARTIKEIAALTNVDVKHIARCFQQIRPHLGIVMNTINTEDYLSRFCNHLDLPNAVFRAAKVVVLRAQPLGILSGKSPISIAAATLYFVASMKPETAKTLKDVAVVSITSEVTIRNAYRELYPSRMVIYPPGYVDEAVVKALPSP